MGITSDTTYPSVDLALVAAHNGLDVVLHDGDQSVLVVDLGDPARKLAVPDKSVATNELAVRLSPVDEVVSTAELEVATRRLGGIELHGVFGCDLAEVGLCGVVDVAVGEGALVTSGAPVPGNSSVKFMNNFQSRRLTDFLPLALKPASTDLAARASMLASGRAAAEASDSTESAAMALEISIVARLEGGKRVCVLKVWMCVM